MVEDYADAILAANDFDNASRFLAFRIQEPKWLASSVFILRMMERCRPEQARKVAWLFDEFMPPAPRDLQRMLVASEYAMFARSKDVSGIEKAIRKQFTVAPKAGR